MVNKVVRNYIEVELSKTLALPSVHKPAILFMAFLFCGKQISLVFVVKI